MNVRHPNGSPCRRILHIRCRVKGTVGFVWAGWLAKRHRNVRAMCGVPAYLHAPGGSNAHAVRFASQTDTSMRTGWVVRAGALA